MGEAGVPLELFRPKPSLSTTFSAHWTRWPAGLAWAPRRRRMAAGRASVWVCAGSWICVWVWVWVWVWADAGTVAAVVMVVVVVVMILILVMMEMTLILMTMIKPSWG